MNTTKSSWKEEFYQLVFWGYNSIYTFFAMFVVLQLVSSGQKINIIDVLTFYGFFPPHVLIMIYTIIATPFISMALASSRKIHTDTRKLMKLFFGFEIPLMGLSLLGTVFLRQVTPVTAILYCSIAFSIIGLLFHLYHPEIKSKLKIVLLMLSQQIALVVASYVFLLGFFFLPIVVAFFLKILARTSLNNIIDALDNALRYGGVISLFLYLFFIILFLLTLAFFAFGPIGAFLTFWRTCTILYKKTVKEFGIQNARLLRYGVSALLIFILVLFSIQTNAQKYASLVSSYNNAQTFEEKQKVAGEIIRQQNQIKKTFTSSYLAQYRYLSDNSMNMLTQGYRNELGTDEKTAQSIQKLFNSLAAPFIYKGTFEEDIKRASEGYQQLFDNSIQKGELKTISKTLQATNTRDSLKAGIIDLDKQTVRIVSRAVTVNELYGGLLSTVTIEEEYENTAREAQEVYYEFALPDNAVLTELKLGPDLQIGANSADKPRPAIEPTAGPSVSTLPTPTTLARVDNAVVAPKGAANTVYENQIFRRTDPAMLVQVGPRQYKLRVYPIPVKGQTIEGQIPVDGVTPKNQKVRYSYVTLRGQYGIPLPVITEKRNVFTDTASRITYRLNGELAYTTDTTEFIKVKQQLPCPSEILETQTAVGPVMFIPHSRNPALTTSYDCRNDFAKTNRFVAGTRIALLLDASYSNTQTDWPKYLADNFPLEKLKQNSTDIYFFNDSLSKKINLSSTTDLKVFNIGQTDRVKALASLPANSYDLIIMVTDDSVFDKKPEVNQLPVNAPVYIVHPNNRIPPYNDVLTNAVIQSNGKVFSNGFEALNHYWQEKSFKNLTSIGSILDTNEYGTWVLANGDISTIGQRQVVNSSSPFGQLAYKRLVMDSMRRAGQRVVDISFLDRIQLVSEQSNIVTSYSSMIVLVTDDQKQQLETARKQSNRYELALDTGEETLGNPSGQGILEVGAVPEPHEWLLIFSGCLLLTYLYREKLRDFTKRYL